MAVDCWLHDPKIKQWGIDHNLTDPYRMFAHFEARLGRLIRPKNTTSKLDESWRHHQRDPSLPPYVNRTMVVWQDVFNDNYQHLAHPEMVAEVWLDQGTLKSIVQQGYRTLWAYPWYLDQQVGLASVGAFMSHPDLNLNFGPT